jgi:hypothetical protein
MGQPIEGLLEVDGRTREARATRAAPNMVGSDPGHKDE